MGSGRRSGPSRAGAGPGSRILRPCRPGLWLPFTSFPCPPPGFDSTAPTCVDIVVSVQGGELLAVVPGEGVPSVAVVAPQPQLVVLALRLQAEAGIFCKDLAARPVLHGHQQFVVALVRQPVNVLQAQPVLAVNVPEPLLGKTWESVSQECAAPSASGQRGSAQDRGAGSRQCGRRAWGRSRLLDECQSRSPSRLFIESAGSAPGIMGTWGCCVTFATWSCRTTCDAVSRDLSTQQACNRRASDKSLPSLSSRSLAWGWAVCEGPTETLKYRASVSVTNVLHPPTLLPRSKIMVLLFCFYM